MNQTDLNSLYDKGGFFVITGLSPNTRLEFGIDLNIWDTAEKFMGLKLIPSGLHLISYSSIDKNNSVGLKSSFFTYFKPGQLLVLNWNKETESLQESTLSVDELSALRNRIRDLDKNLGCYPILDQILDQPGSSKRPKQNSDLYDQWIKLTNYISENTLANVFGCSSIIRNVYTFSSATGSGYDTREYQDAIKTLESINNNVEDKNQNKIISNNLDDKLDFLNNEPGKDSFFFKTIDLKKSFDSKTHTPSQISSYSVDKSFLLANVLNRYSEGPIGLLGEMQITFLLLLIGQNFAGFEHYKQIVGLVTQSSSAIAYSVGNNKEFDDILGDNTKKIKGDSLLKGLFVPFTKILIKQLKHCPEDFFSSLLTSDNFFVKCIRDYIVNVGVTDSNVEGIELLNSEMEELRTVFKKRFNVDLPTYSELLEAEEEGSDNEYAPVIV
ncbi:hypothetical protein BB560_003709 [Smittium megazygosporum]|uniref:A1 cistron-splicing factor AAR2 n=1 Tax=Smittium megazygosporum TaxID=133381 RepID=A0A2T9ZBC6_9FUNG|nr:hypothetical protein BB560_003709 [Smittium megazygosporum]